MLREGDGARADEAGTGAANRLRAASRSITAAAWEVPGIEPPRRGFGRTTPVNVPAARHGIIA